MSFVALRLAGVVRESIVDGPGIRFVVFVQGCPHHCDGCHNAGSWDFTAGYDCDIDQIIDAIDKNPLLKGVTFSGGEPFEQSTALLELAKQIKHRHLNLIIYTGYLFDDLLKRENDDVQNLIKQADYIVDGKFEKSLMSHELRFRGSSNQRIIDVAKSLESGAVIETEF